MKVQLEFVLVCIFTVIFLMYMHFHYHFEAAIFPGRYRVQFSHDYSITIKNNSDLQLTELNALLQHQDALIFELKKKLEVVHDLQQRSPLNTTTNTNTNYALEVLPTSLSDSCESRYGMKLIDNWRDKAEVWCDNDDTLPVEYRSKLVCYPYHQEHKKLDGRGPDMFCEATNFIIDFSKVFLFDDGYEIVPLLMPIVTLYFCINSSH